MKDISNLIKKSIAAITASRATPPPSDFTEPYTGNIGVIFTPTRFYYISKMGGDVKYFQATPDTPKPLDFLRIASNQERLAYATEGQKISIPIRYKPGMPEIIGGKTTTIKKSFVDKFFDGINTFLSKKAK
jgi:hypothetical protein